MHANQYTYTPLAQELLQEIQAYYDAGNSMRAVHCKFNLSFCKLNTLRKKGLLSFNRNECAAIMLAAKKRRGFKHSDATRKVLSDKRKQWLEHNSDIKPWVLSHKSRGETYAEKYFREWLQTENIEFIQEYKFSRFSFDFLVGNVDLEIDGAQHKNDKRIAQHDIKRTQIIEQAGFIVYRVFWPSYMTLTVQEREAFLYDLKRFLLRQSTIKPQLTLKEKQTKRKAKVDPRREQAIALLRQGCSYVSVAARFNVSDNAVRRWVRAMGLDPKQVKKKNK